MRIFLFLGIAFLLFGTKPQSAFGQPEADKTPDAVPIAYGKPLPYWIEQLKADDVLVREEAIEVLAELGDRAKEALPALTALRHHDNKYVRIRAAAALWAIGRQGNEALAASAEAIRDPQPSFRLRAVTLGLELGADAVPVLLTGLGDSAVEVRDLASAGLKKLGSAAVPGLVKAIRQPDLRIRRQAVDILGAATTADEPAKRALGDALQDADPWTRIQAAHALSRLDRDNVVAVPVLIDLARSEDAKLRNQALATLFQMSPRPKAATGIYNVALKATDPTLRVQAADALWETEKQVVNTVPVLIDVVKLADAPTRKLALATLGRMGPQAKEALPALLELLHSKLGMVDPSLYDTVVRMGPAAIGPLIESLQKNRRGHPEATLLGRLGKDAVKPLLPLLEHSEVQVRMAACRALMQIGADAAEAVPRLMEMLAETTSNDQISVIAALRDIGGPAKAAAPRLAELVASKQVNVRLAALTALDRLKPDRRTMIDVYTKALTDANFQVRLQAAEILIRTDRANPAAMKVIIWALQDKDVMIRRYAIGVLDRVHDYAKPAVPTLAEMLTDRDTFVRRQAAWLLGRIGADARAALPELKEAMRDKEVQIRLAAAEAMSQFAEEPEATVPVLLEAFKPINGALFNGGHKGLRRYGPRAKQAIPIMQKLVNEPTSRAGSQPILLDAAETLFALDADQGKLVKAKVLEVLQKPNTQFQRVHAARILCKIERSIPQGVSALNSLLGDPIPMVRQKSVEALGELGADAKIALPSLTPLLRDADNSLRVFAAAAIVKIDPEYEAARPVLLEGLKHATFMAQEQAAIGLGDLQSVTPAALTALQEAEYALHAPVRIAAKESLGKIHARKKNQR